MENNFLPVPEYLKDEIWFEDGKAQTLEYVYDTLFTDTKDMQKVARLVRTEINPFYNQEFNVKMIKHYFQINKSSGDVNTYDVKTNNEDCYLRIVFPVKMLIFSVQSPYGIINYRYPYPATFGEYIYYCNKAGVELKFKTPEKV